LEQWEDLHKIIAAYGHYLGKEKRRELSKAFADREPFWAVDRAVQFSDQITDPLFQYIEERCDSLTEELDRLTDTRILPERIWQLLERISN